MARSCFRALLTAAAVFLPSLATAHPGHGEAFGFTHGLGHPFGGVDHVLAMVMVGVLAAQLGNRAVWLVPASFITVMALGGGLGLAGVEMPFVEVGIALSVVVLGAILAFGLTASVAAIQGLVAFFAIFHGYAHGAEMPEMAGGIVYGAGFIFATGLLHALGLVLGGAARVKGATLVKGLGAVASLAGVGILVGAL